MLASAPMDDALRTTHAVHSGADPATLRTGGIPVSTLPGREPVFSPGEEADMLAIARAQLTTYALASRLSEDDERAQASASSLLVSRETCPRTWCWHHGNANITLQPSLPGKVGTVHSLSVPGMPDTTVSTQ